MSAADTLKGLVIAEAIREAGEIPSGRLYAHVCGHFSIDGYQAVIAALKRTGLVSEAGHLLTWTGPKIAPSKKDPTFVDPTVDNDKE